MKATLIVVSGLIGSAIAPTLIFMGVAFTSDITSDEGEPLTFSRKAGASVLGGALFGLGSAAGGIALSNAAQTCLGKSGDSGVREVQQ